MDDGIIKTAGDFLKAITDGMDLDVRYYNDSENKWGEWGVYQPELDSYLKDVINEFKDGAEYRFAQIKRYNIYQTMKMLVDGKKMKNVTWSDNAEVYIHFVDEKLVDEGGNIMDIDFYRDIIFVEVE